MTSDEGSQPSPWADDPIGSAAEDTLGRSHLAERTAELVVETHSWESSVVLGLVGPWGSGKSSVLSMTMEALNEARPDWKVVRFTPWSANDIDGMLAEFYAALVTALPDEKFATFRSRLANVVELSAPAAGQIPYVGLIAKGGLDYFKKRLRAQKPWAEAFKGASDELKRLGTPLLVVADDVDRLQGEELLGFLKLVRLVGRFPGITYLLGYDEESLRRTIETASGATPQGVNSRVFLEKFVQYPVYLPPLLAGQALRHIDTVVNEALASGAHSVDANDHRLASIGDSWTVLLDTPRAIRRFGAQLRLVLPLHEPGEIDVVDLVLLTLLRMHLPSVYGALPRNRQRLLGRDVSAHLGTTPSGFDWPRLFGGLTTDGERESAKAIVESLFPNTQFSGGTSGARPRVSHPEYFDRYFLLSIPEDDVPDHVVSQALRDASAGHSEQLASLLTTDVGDRIDTAINKLWSFSTDAERALQLDCRELLGSVVSAIPGLDGRKNSIFNRQQRAIRWAVDLFKSIPGDVPSKDIAEALRRCPDTGLTAEILWSSTGGDALSANTREALEMLVADVREAFLGHLGLGDRAPLDASTVTMASFLATFDAELTATAINAQFPEAFDAADYAARFVSLSYVLGPKPAARVYDFAIQSFQKLTRFDDPFFHDVTSNDLDENDVSWAGRKAYARGRALTGVEGPDE